MNHKEGFISQMGQLIWPICLYYVINNAVVILGITALQSMELWAISESWQIYLEAGIKMLGMILGALAVYPYFRRENGTWFQVGRMLGNKKLRIAEGMGIAVWGAVTALFLNFVFSYLDIMQSSEQYQQVAKTQFALPIWLAMISYGIIAPVVEELVFRGIVYRTLKRNTNEMWAIMGSALLFGGFHGNMVQMIYGTIMGVIMALIYQKYSVLLAPMLFHSAANIAVYLCSYFF